MSTPSSNESSSLRYRYLRVLLSVIILLTALAPSIPKLLPLMCNVCSVVILVNDEETSIKPLDVISQLAHIKISCSMVLLLIASHRAAAPVSPIGLSDM